MAALMSEVTPDVCVTEAQMAFKSLQSSPFMLTLPLFIYLFNFYYYCAGGTLWHLQ
jgi:hypothetical protein